MKIVVLADVASKEEFEAKKISHDIEVIFIENFSEASDHGSADAFFLLKEEIEKARSVKWIAQLISIKKFAYFWNP